MSSYDWKQPMTREELYDIHRVAAMRGKYKAVKRHTLFVKRSVEYQKRSEEAYQTKLGMYYRLNFS